MKEKWGALFREHGFCKFEQADSKEDAWSYIISWRCMAARHFPNKDWSKEGQVFRINYDENTTPLLRGDSDRGEGLIG